jgi:hypothetical protein
MTKKVIRAISEQTEQILTKFSEEVDYSLQDIADEFAVFAKDYKTFEEAVDNLMNFVDEAYIGTDVNRFKDMIRSGYSVIVDTLLDSSRSFLEARVLRSI